MRRSQMRSLQPNVVLGQVWLKCGHLCQRIQYLAEASLFTFGLLPLLTSDSVTMATLLTASILPLNAVHLSLPPLLYSKLRRNDMRVATSSWGEKRARQYAIQVVLCFLIIPRMFAHSLALLRFCRSSMLMFFFIFRIIFGVREAEKCQQLWKQRANKSFCWRRMSQIMAKPKSFSSFFLFVLL